MSFYFNRFKLLMISIRPTIIKINPPITASSPIFSKYALKNYIQFFIPFKFKGP
jgi:hypothetical protein